MLSSSYVHQGQATVPPARSRSSLTPSPHNTRQAVENSESGSGSLQSYVEGGQPGEGPGPLPHVKEGYTTLSRGQTLECLKVTLERPKHEQHKLDFILSDEKVARFLLNKGNFFDVSIFEWEYEPLTNYGWYHGNIDKLEARKRLDRHQVVLSC